MSWLLFFNTLNVLILFFLFCIIVYFFLGKYVFIEASSPRVNGDNARLLSGNIPASNNACLHFWYNMNGASVGILRVYSQQSGANALPLWQLNGNKGTQWNQAQVKIPPQKTDFKVDSHRIITLILLLGCEIYLFLHLRDELEGNYFLLLC